MNEPPAPHPALELRDIVALYGERRALDAVSLSAGRNDAVGLLGPNGSGKSTLLSLVAGLRRPAQGTVRVFGTAPEAGARRHVGVVFQESCLDSLMTVEETLVLHGRLYGLGGGPLSDRIGRLLSRFDLAERARDRVGVLSGGLKRRLELARALLPDPALLLLDEPTTGLDPDSRRAFWRHVREERERGLTFVLASNDVHEAERECSTVYFLHHGRVIASGSPEALKAGLKHDSVRVECTDGRAEAMAQAIASWPDVGGVRTAGQVLHITVDDASSFVPRLFQTGGDGIHTITIEPSTLEDAYFQVAGAPLTGREGNDA